MAIEIEGFIEALKHFQPFRVLNNQDFKLLLDFVMTEFKDDNKISTEKLRIMALMWC